MQDFDLISRQLRRELEQGELKRQRLENNTRRAEENKYASSTVYGQQALKAATGAVADHMSRTLKSLGRGKGCVDGSTVYKHLKAADPEILAVLGLKVCLDILAQEKAPQLADLTVAIGSAIEIEQKLAWYRQQDPDLFNRIKKGFHGSTGTAQVGTATIGKLPHLRTECRALRDRRAQLVPRRRGAERPDAEAGVAGAEHLLPAPSHRPGAGPARGTAALRLCAS